MTNLQQELSKAIKEYSITEFNKKEMQSYFGVENLKNYPFRKIEVILAQSTSQGTERFKIDLDTFKTEQYCHVGSWGEQKITDAILKKIEVEMFNKLGVKRIV